jgi:hypothetical protein
VSTDDVIYTYTRAHALADGVLIDVSRQASTAEMLGGFSIPVAITTALQNAIDAIPPSLEGVADYRGRLHDVLWMAACAARQHLDTDQCHFLVLLPSRGTRKRTRVLVLHVGPDDAGAPCVTIGFPEDF